MRYTTYENMAIAYLGIGSNIGNKRSNCNEALSRLQAAEGIRIIASSSLYETRPVGGPPQENYLNGVLKIETKIPPEKFFDTLKDIEKGMGRVRAAGRDHPRVIDIDILLYDNAILKTDKLIIPHPRMHERYFVLRGLAEIAPGLAHPVLGKTVEELYNASHYDDR